MSIYIFGTVWPTLLRCAKKIHQHKQADNGNVQKTAQQNLQPVQSSKIWKSIEHIYDSTTPKHKFKCIGKQCFKQTFSMCKSNAHTYNAILTLE